MQIFVPSDIEVGSSQRVVETCSNGVNLRSSFTCELSPVMDGQTLLGHELWVRGAFPEEGLRDNQKFLLQVLPKSIT